MKPEAEPTRRIKRTDLWSVSLQNLCEPVESGSNDGQTEFYASPCDYFDNGQCTRESIYRELQDYNNKWPSREYRLLGTPLVNITNEQNAYSVAFKVAFTLRNHSKTLSSTCDFRAEVVRRQNSFLITSIRA